MNLRRVDLNAQVYLTEIYTRLFELTWNTEHIILAIYSALLEVREGIPEAEAPPPRDYYLRLEGHFYMQTGSPHRIIYKTPPPSLFVFDGGRFIGEKYFPPG